MLPASLILSSAAYDVADETFQLNVTTLMRIILILGSFYNVFWYMFNWSYAYTFAVSLSALPDWSLPAFTPYINRLIIFPSGSFLGSNSFLFRYLWKKKCSFLRYNELQIELLLVSKEASIEQYYNNFNQFAHIVSPLPVYHLGLLPLM